MTNPAARATKATTSTAPIGVKSIPDWHLTIGDEDVPNSCPVTMSGGEIAALVKAGYDAGVKAGVSSRPASVVGLREIVRNQAGAISHIVESQALDRR